jgi:hypothetical protein
MVYDLYEVGCAHCKHIEIKNLMGVLGGQFYIGGDTFAFAFHG